MPQRISVGRKKANYDHDGIVFPHLRSSVGYFDSFAARRVPAAFFDRSAPARAT